MTLNSLRLFKELELTGGIVRINREIVAFTIGEELCEDTFVVHIEKAYANIQGAYPMINRRLWNMLVRITPDSLIGEKDTGSQDFERQSCLIDQYF